MLLTLWTALRRPSPHEAQCGHCGQWSEIPGDCALWRCWSCDTTAFGPTGQITFDPEDACRSVRPRPSPPI